MTVVAVTGAAGFIGRATCQALINAGNDVRGLLRSDRARALLPAAVNIVVTGDLAHARDLERSVAACDAVIHLAARSSAESAQTAASIVAENSLVTERVIRAAAHGGAKRFLYVSSVKAVGEHNSAGAWSEETVPHPTEPYGQSKLAAEHTVQKLGPELGIEVVIIRPPMVYGRWVGGNFRQLCVLARISHWIPLPLAGIANRRSTLFVENLADALALLSNHPDASGETFFVSDGGPHSTPDIVRTIASALGRRAKLFSVSPQFLDVFAHLGGKGGEMKKLRASLEIDDTKLRRLTSWAPPYSFERAIALTVSAGGALV
jgi:nucleoside-diphosphate-sugar epimerase